MSRLEILSHDIFNDEEIQKYNLTIDNLPFIKSNTVIFKEMLAFCLSLPNFTKTKYNKALIIPMPNNNSHELNTQITQVLSNDNTIFEIPTQGMKQSKLIKHKNNCFRNILNNTMNCEYKINKFESIEQYDNILILKNLEETNMIHNCNGDSPRIMNGNYIIHFHICNIKIKNINYINEENVIIHTVVIPKINVNKNKTINNYTLEKLHLDQITNREIIEQLLREQSTSKNMSYVSIATIIVIIIVICSLMTFKLNTKNQSKMKNEIKIKFENPPKDPFRLN